MEHLNKHMEIIHQETAHMRIERLTRTFQSRVNKTPENSRIQQINTSKIFDCSECGTIYSTNEA